MPFSYYSEVMWYILYKVENGSMTMIYSQFYLNISKIKLKITVRCSFEDTSLNFVWCEYGDASLDHLCGKECILGKNDGMYMK